MAKNTAAKASELGKDYERKYGGCSQCTVAALQDALGARDDALFKAATGLAAGCGALTDGACGAYSGAILVLGSLFGRERETFDDVGRMRDNFALVKQLHDRFIGEYGSVICRDIQTRLLGRPYYLADPDEYMKFVEAGAHDTHCPNVVGNAARWAAEIIEESGLP
jgi:C_GCAxxG_C_C family probable redox protein